MYEAVIYLSFFHFFKARTVVFQKRNYLVLDLNDDTINIHKM